ncbi:MAG: SpoVG family protein [Firmicutes bacterium]|nr:SpoVG family protein [Bacillota bacterium]
MIIEVKRFHRVEDGSKLKGFADVSLENAITIRGVRLVEGPNGTFAGMPRRKENDGNYHDIVSVEDREFRKALTNALIREYQKSDRFVPAEWPDEFFE